MPNDANALAPAVRPTIASGAAVDRVGVMALGATAAVSARPSDPAQAFEAAFIGQMLQHAGFGEALTGSVQGPAAAHFAGFAIEAIAARVAEHAPFGIAELVRARLDAEADGGPLTTGLLAPDR
ncbi:MAG: hypothetical protein AAF677_11935 [Pseudomonadota bacterium]